MTIEDVSPTVELGDFFDTLWGDTEGYVYLPIRHPDSGEWKKYFYEWPTKRDNIINNVLKATAQGFDVYSAPAIFDIPNPARENVRGSHVLWMDFDGNAPTDWSPEALTQRSGADSVVPEPTLRVQSSTDGHEHVYWRLDDFSTDPEWVEGANRSLAYSLGADTSGWDRNQILRPPSTTNYKHGLPVTTARNTHKRFSADSFRSLRPATQLVSDSVDTDRLPDVEGVVAKYRWDSDHYDLFRKPEVEQGDRSSALMRLGYFCCEAGMTDAEAFSILSNADDRWGKFKGRDDRKRRLLEIVNRARQKHPVGNDELNFRGLLEMGQPDPVEINTEMLFGFQDFLDSEVHVEWIIEGLLERGGLGMVASKPGVGKTQLTIQLGICAALGIPFLGWTITRPLKVLLLSLEMSHVALKLFMETISRHYSPEELVVLQSNFKIVPMGDVLPFDTQEGQVYLESLLAEEKPDLVLVDSIGKTTTKKLDDEKARQLSNIWKRLARKYETAWWFIHHNRKESDNNKTPTRLDDIYGSVYLTTDMTSVLIMWDAGEGPAGLLEVVPVKSRLALLRDKFPVFRDPDLHFTLAKESRMSNLLESLEVTNKDVDDHFPSVE